MSPLNSRSSANPANVIHPAEPLVPLSSGRAHAWVQDDAATEDPPVTDPRLLRPATSPGPATSFGPTASVRMAPSRNLRRRPFDDPCNYLG